MTWAEFYRSVERSPKAVLVEFIRDRLRADSPSLLADDLRRARARLRADTARRRERDAYAAALEALKRADFREHARQMEVARAAYRAWNRAMDDAYPRRTDACQHPMHDGDCDCGHPPIEDAG